MTHYSFLVRPVHPPAQEPPNRNQMTAAGRRPHQKANFFTFSTFSTMCSELNLWPLGLKPPAFCLAQRLEAANPSTRWAKNVGRLGPKRTALGSLHLPGLKRTWLARPAASPTEVGGANRDRCPGRFDSPARLTSAAGGGGANRDRTGDLLLAKQALSQLSYGPVLFGRSWSLAPFFAAWREGLVWRLHAARHTNMVGPGRFELPTPRLSSVCSNQLSYEPSSPLPARSSASLQKPRACSRKGYVDGGVFVFRNRQNLRA